MLKPRSLSPQKTLRHFDKPIAMDSDDQSSRLSRARSFRETLLNSVFERSMVSESSEPQLSFSQEEDVSPYGKLGFHDCMSFSPQEKTIDWKYLASEVLYPSIYFSKALKKLQVEKQENLKHSQCLLPIAHFENSKRRGNSVCRSGGAYPRRKNAFKSFSVKTHKKLLVSGSKANLGRRDATLLVPLSASLQRNSMHNLKHNKKILELETDIEDLQDEHHQAVKEFKMISKTAQKLLNNVSRNSPTNSSRRASKSRPNSRGRMSAAAPSINVSTASSSRLVTKPKQYTKKQSKNSSFFDIARPKSSSMKSASRFINRVHVKENESKAHTLNKDDLQFDQTPDEKPLSNGKQQSSQKLTPGLNENNWRLKMRLPKISSTKYDKLLKYQADTNKEVKRHKSSKILALINSHQKGLIYKMVSQIPKTYIISKKCYKRQSMASNRQQVSQFWMSNYMSQGSFGKSQVLQRSELLH